MDKKNKSLNVYFACAILLFVEHSHFLMVNTEELKYNEVLFIQISVHVIWIDY